MKQPSESTALVIAPLIERHVGDAAFYWAQRDRSAHSALIDLDELQQFDSLLQAHLDGIRAAGNAGWPFVQNAVQRWNSAAEVFVYAVLALASTEGHRHAQLIAIVQRDPQRLLRGLISAVLWLPPTQALPWLQKWLQPSQSPLLQTAAWRIAALAPELLHAVEHMHDWWARALAHEDAHVRAAACRAAVHMPQAQPALHTALKDADLAVMAEAAIALQRTGILQGQSQLLHAVQQRSAQAAAATGYHKKQALHQLERWVRYLALSLPSGSEMVEPLLENLPERLGLELVLHHGDAKWLPWVQTQMHNPECARMAGWVWSCLTGVDLDANELAIEETDHADEQREYPTDMLDPGLSMPNAHAIARFPLEIAQGVALLGGEPLAQVSLAEVWQQAPQALRWIVMQRNHALHLNNRAHGREQRSQLEGAEHSAVLGARP